MSLSLYVPVDVDYQNDPKIIAAGPLAECLYVRALALSKRTMSDGLIHRGQLPGLALGLPGARAKHARALVDAGLWAEHPDGWQITAWAKWNPSAATIRENQQIRTAAGAKANHDRWHVGPTGKPKIGCPHCSESDPNRTPNTDENGLPKGREGKAEGREGKGREGNTSSSSPSLTLVPTPHQDDDDREFIDQVLGHIASIRMQTRQLAPGAMAAYKATTITNLATARPGITLEHRRLPDLDAGRLAEHWEARPDLHPAPAEPPPLRGEGTPQPRNRADSTHTARNPQIGAQTPERAVL